MKGIRLARVPDVRGWAEEDAKSAISEAGLVPVVQTGSDQTVDVGEVYDQSIAAGTRVDSGTTVTIYVRSQDAAGETPADEGGTWKAEGQALGQPASYQGGKVKIELVQTDDQGNTYSDQSMEVENPEFPLSISDLTGRPGIATGTVGLYEWIGDSYQIIDQYDVTFQKVD